MDIWLALLKRVDRGHGLRLQHLEQLPGRFHLLLPLLPKRAGLEGRLQSHGCLPSSCLAANSSSSNTSGTSPSAGGKNNQTIFYGSSGTGANSAGATLTASDALTTATVSYYFDDVETTTVGTIIDLCITVHAPAVERPCRRDSGCTSTQQQQQQHATQQHQEQPIAIQRSNSQTAADDQLTSRTGGKQLTFATLVWFERVH